MCSGQDRVLRISLLLSAAALFAHAETPLERGKYLVENASMCGDCHTPMLNGKPDASKQLKGSTLGFQPIGEVPGWHKTAPDISSTSQLFGRWAMTASRNSWRLVSTRAATRPILPCRNTVSRRKMPPRSFSI